MPTGFKFDDLDLREQPARGGHPGSDGTTTASCLSKACMTMFNCTETCCTADCSEVC